MVLSVAQSIAYRRRNSLIVVMEYRLEGERAEPPGQLMSKGREGIKIVDARE